MFVGLVLTIIRRCFDANVFDGEHSIEQVTVAHINIRLQQWYGVERALNPHVDLAEICPLHVAAVGKANKKKLSAKGREAFHVCRFLVDSFFPEFAARVHNGIALLQAGDALMSWSRYLKTLPDVVPQDACDRCMQLCARFLNCLMDAEIDFKPKHHAFVHLNRRTVTCKCRNVQCDVHACIFK